MKTKLLLTVLSVLMLSYNVDGGVGSGSGLTSHFTYTFCHANVWHLACNLFVLWSIRNRMATMSAYVIAVAASWLPMWADKPTVGMSGMLFAMFGIMWGRTGMKWKCAKAGLPVILVMMLIPNVNGLLHLYCYVIGYVISDLFVRYKFKL